jgi:hypothetical protein
MIIAMIVLGKEALTGTRWKPGTYAGFQRSAYFLLILIWIAYGGIRLALDIAR